MSNFDFEKIIGSLGQAVKQALAAVDEHSMKSYLEHFDTVESSDGSKQLNPKMVSVPVPKPDGTYQTRKVPQVALLNHNSLQMEDMRIKFRIALSTDETSNGESAGSLPSLRGEIGPGARAVADNDGNLPEFAEVEVHFKRGEPPEGIARISDTFYKSI